MLALTKGGAFGCNLFKPDEEDAAGHGENAEWGAGKRVGERDQGLGIKWFSGGCAAEGGERLKG